MGLGEQCVMIAGTSMMPMWFVVSWASLAHPPFLAVQNSVKGLVPPGWIMSTVMEEKPHYLIVRMQGGE